MVSKGYKIELNHEDKLEVLKSVLDLLDEKILLIDKNGWIRYFNQKYADYYGQVWLKGRGIKIDDILKENLYDIKDPASEILQAVIRTMKRQDKFFNNPDATVGHDVFSDIYPIYLRGEPLGILVVEHDSELITKLNNQLNYYKSLNESLKQKLNNKKDLPVAFLDVVGESTQMMQVLNTCAHVAPTGSSVCLLGESGTGKEVLAEAIHKSSKAFGGPFIKVNCAAIPDNLIESELFGYVGGAFTGANAQGQAGKFELANGGTLFLDEIGEMPLAMQAKLLRAIQEKEITRIGGSKTIKLNFRLLTATNRNLEKMIEEGTFREDLYYRICVIPINIPPLRERKEDIPLLANDFLTSLSTSMGVEKVFSEEVMNQLKSYSWPGNIRELKNCVERMAVLCPDECIGAEYLPLQITKSAFGSSENIEGNYNLYEIVEKVEYDAIKTVLAITQGNKSKATKILGISKRNLYMKLEKYGLNDL